MSTYNNNNNNTDDEADVDSTNTSTHTRTRKLSFQLNELESSLPFLPPMVTSKRRITSRDWNIANKMNEESALPRDFSFTDNLLEHDPCTSALNSFSESERSLFSTASDTTTYSTSDVFKSNHTGKCPSKVFCIPSDLDVLLGRGGQTNNHSGNIKYREEVEKVKPMYFSCMTKSEKKEVSELLVAYVQDYGGRFLEKDPDTGEWMLASDRAARKKASQALRETKWKQTKFKKEEQPG